MNLAAKSEVVESTQPCSTVLVVEDDLVTLEVMRLFLEDLGYRVFTAGLVTEARLICEQQSIDILISDLGLPDGYGGELMREFGAGSPMYGIAISGYEQSEEISESGFHERLLKPIRFEALEEILHKAQQRFTLA